MTKADRTQREKAELQTASRRLRNAVQLKLLPYFYYLPEPVTVTGCELWIGSSLWMGRISGAAGPVALGLNLIVTVFFFPLDNVKVLVATE